MISNYIVLTIFRAKFDCNFFNHFSYMYVGLIIKDECERSVKNQLQKLNKWIL